MEFDIWTLLYTGYDVQYNTRYCLEDQKWAQRCTAVSRVEIGIASAFCFVQVPYDDLRYLFGEIMYGGHITDDWDRRLCRTYLEEFIKPEMMEGELYLAPGFPLPGHMDYNGYHQVNAPPATSLSHRNGVKVRNYYIPTVCTWSYFWGNGIKAGYWNVMRSNPTYTHTCDCITVMLFCVKAADVQIITLKMMFST